MEPQRRGQPFTALGRRAFLQLGGSSLLILGVAPLPIGCGSDADTETPRPPWRMLVADPALCGGCARCAITCAAMLGEPFTPNRSLVGPDRVHHEYVFSDPYWYAESCHMCPDLSEGGKRVSPACVANCPRGAAQIAQPGHPMYGDLPVRFIDQELCVGCGICVDRCPYGHPLLLLAAARKCDLCLGHPDFTGVPACVEQCPASALLYLDYPATAAPRPFPWEQSA